MWCTLNDTIVMSLNCLFVIFPIKSCIHSFWSHWILHTQKKQQTATNVWWIPKIYTWNFVVNCLYPNNNGMLSTRGTTWRITWHKCKGLSFQRQGVSTLNCSKMQTQGCPISNAQLLNKGRYMPTVRIIMTSTNGRSGKFASFPKLHAGE